MITCYTGSYVLADAGLEQRNTDRVYGRHQGAPELYLCLIEPIDTVSELQDEGGVLNPVS